MASRNPNSGQYREQPGHYVSPDQDTPSPNTSEVDSQPHMDGFDGFSFHYHTDINGLPVTNEPHLPQTHQPAFDPQTAGHSGMRYRQHAGFHHSLQGHSGLVRPQQPIDRDPQSHFQHPNLQTQTSPTGIWNPSITAQILPNSAPSVFEAQPTSTIATTPGFGVGDSAHGPALFPTPNPPREVRQNIDLSHFYRDVVHPAYRNIRLKCHLKDPKGYQPNSKIIVRREKRVVLEMQLRADCERMGWKGIALPRTGSVKQSNQQTPTGLLHFSIEVHGSTTGMCLNQPCDNCWRREMRPLGNPHGLPHYLIDFKSDSPFILFPRVDTLPYAKAEVTFHFTCYSNHQKEDYELVARLHDEHGNLIAYHQIPYSFKSVPKPDRGDVLPEDYPSIPSVVSPVPVATMPAAASPSTLLNSTSGTRRTAEASGQRPGYSRAASNRHPAPPTHHALQYESVGVQPPSVGGSSRTNIQQQNAVDQPLLQKVAPIEGPTRGGLNIVLIGANFPPWPTIIYARFGSAVAATSWINPYTLECTLPTSPTSGLVDVTLSLGHDHNAPMFGQSLCTFSYREEQESFLLMLRSIYSQGHELSRVALDVLIPQILQHASPETLNHALRRHAQSQDSLPPIDDRELEELGVRFLATISDSLHWSDDLSFVDENHQTIAHLCVLSGYTRLLTKVIEWDIDLDVQDVSGLTALHFAYLREDWDCVRILKEAGASEYIKDNLGRMPRRMCQYVETEGTIHSEGEEPSTPARFSSAGEDEWVDVPSRVSASPENSTQLGTQPRLQLPWQTSSIIKAADGGTRAPIPRPLSEGSSIADNESWTSAFSDLQITESPPPMTRAPSSVTSSSGTRGGGAPPVSQYGWSHRTYPPSPPRLQRNASHAVSAKHAPPPTSSFHSLPAFPMPQPAVPSFPVAEPTGIEEESDDCADTPSQPSSQRNSPSPVSPSQSRRHSLVPTSLPHASHTTRSDPLAVTRTIPSQRNQPSHQLSPGTPGTGYGPPPGPPPPVSVPSKRVVPSSPPQVSPPEKDEKAVIRQQLQEIRRTAWPSADQEKEKMKFKGDQKTAILDKGALADPKVFTRLKVKMDPFQQPKQREA